MKSTALVALAVFAVTGCALKKSGDAISASQIAFNATDPNAEVPGVGSTSIPSTEALVARIVRGLEGTVNPTAGNFNALLNTNGLRTATPAVTNPLTAAGFDTYSMLSYAACVDTTVNTNNVVPATATFGINLNQTIAQQRTNLVNAGLRIVNHHVGGLATTGSRAAQARAIFEKLVDDNARVTGETTTIVWISVCMTANTFGVSMTGS